MTRLRGVTAYQLELLGEVARCRGLGFDVDLDQLVETLSWKPTKQSLQFSIRALIAKRMLMKTGFATRRGRKRICFALDVEGHAVLDPRGTVSTSGAALPEKEVTPSLEVSDHLLPIMEGDLEDLPGAFEVLEDE